MTEQSGMAGPDLEAMLLATLKNHPSGVTQNILMESIPALSVLELAQLLNKLIAQNKIKPRLPSDSSNSKWIFPNITSCYSDRRQRDNLESKVLVEDRQYYRQYCPREKYR
ncbi:hypothetical protein AVEN_141538-1 [Araneus ventricosus]|uniref:Uncharacterized protein n=1 Tax=Araneus ventricosus TaxID=182803 RepID=A0A4Y2VQ50_ARAVE|nr:hypothetical protein AVEN_141538-1 [Araneus ventricosus]